MKKILKLFIPPIIIKLYNLVINYNFKKFWKKNKKNFSDNHEFKIMFDFFVNSANYKFVSNYWHYLNIKHLQELLSNKKDLKDYSTSIAKNYFTFINVKDEEIKGAFENIKQEYNSEKINLFKKQENFSYIESMRYNNLVYLLWLNAKKNNLEQKIIDLGDLGYLSYNDPYIDINDKKITSDKINSIFDYEYINSFIDLDIQNHVLEIGAGSGRTSQAILKFNEKLKYTICDIPPALYISYERLKNVFKNKKVGLIYNEKTEKSLKNKINELDISFIMPDQLNLIKNKSFDLTIAIDCMHEMDKSVIKYYLNNLNNISSFFYFSVWKNTYVPFSGNIKFTRNNLDYFKNDYNIPENWHKKFEKESIFPSNFICSGYEIM
jgi:putative sugar O-methyltransferase